MLVRYYSQCVSFVLGVLCFGFCSVLGTSCFVYEWEALGLGGSSFSVEVVVDSLGVSFMGVVLLVTGSVLGFSKSYMGGELNSNRFFLIVMGFVFSMMLLILFPNLFGLMVGWDGLGVVSYLLVVWYPSSDSLSAGMLTGMSNRLGDVFLVVGVLLLMSGGGESFSLEVLAFLSSFLVVGAMTKSAQYPFSAWLPAAMAAPTPVSSLVHSSTLVTAGVYLLVRYFSSLSSASLMIIHWSSLLTMSLAGVAACVEFDLKKVVALSTLSQVSIMLYSLSSGMPLLAYLHLVSHAVFKAMMFICVGFIIHSYSQDIRRLGHCFMDCPCLGSYFFCSCLCLCGIPFFSGFYSKDMILEGLFGSGFSFLSVSLFLVSVLITGVYSFRLLVLGFIGYWEGSPEKRFNQVFLSEEEVHPCCGVLFISSLFLGSVGASFIKAEVNLFSSLLFKGFLLYLPWLGLFFLLAILLQPGVAEEYKESCKESVRETRFYSFFSDLGFLVGLSSQPWAWVSFSSSDALHGYLDQGWLERVGPKGAREVFCSFLEKEDVSAGGWSFNNFFLLYLVVFVLVFLVGGSFSSFLGVPLPVSLPR